ncbi:MAG: acyl-CoA synthetase [Rhodospirillales bacterium]
MGGQVTSGERNRSQTEIGQRAARAATGLKALGFGPGDAVALMLRNDFAFFEASFASALLGGYAVPINWHLKGDEAGYIIRDCAAKAVVVHADLLPQIANDILAGVKVLVVPTPPELASAYGLSAQQAAAPNGATVWDEWLEAQAPWQEPPKQAPNTMIYTSGTTGRPKGVRRQAMTPQQLEAVTKQTMAIFGLRPDLRAAITGPMYHSAPNFYALNGLRLGAQLWLQPRFDAEELLQWIERYKLEGLHMVPIMFVRLLKLPEAVKRKYDLSSLKHVVHAAAPCPPEVKQAMIDWWGPIIHEYYGATESGAVVHCDSVAWQENSGTVGKPHDNCDVKILDADGQELPNGEIGEVYIRNGNFPDFTYNNMDAKRREIERDGLITAGDVGYLNERGFLFLCDRSKDMIISGGVNIYPAEIEAVLHTMPGVQDCAVFGIPDDEYGEAVAAVVEQRPGAALDVAQVRDYLRQRIAGYKVPRLVEFKRDLPREDSGKIFKRKLRDPYWESAGRRI